MPISVERFGTSKRRSAAYASWHLIIVNKLFSSNDTRRPLLCSAPIQHVLQPATVAEPQARSTFVALLGREQGGACALLYYFGGRGGPGILAAPAPRYSEILLYSFLLHNLLAFVSDRVAERSVRHSCGPIQSYPSFIETPCKQPLACPEAALLPALQPNVLALSAQHQRGQCIGEAIQGRLSDPSGAGHRDAREQLQQQEQHGTGI